jgi:hypothetical protein
MANGLVDEHFQWSAGNPLAHLLRYVLPDGLSSQILSGTGSARSRSRVTASVGKVANSADLPSDDQLV